MAVAKMETAAEKYRRLKIARALQGETEEFVSPSGMTWQLRRPTLEQFLASGVMPVELAMKVAEQQAAGMSEQELAQTMSANDALKSIKFMGDLVRYCAVSPRIVDIPRQGEDEIGVAEVEWDDFMAIVNWAKPGGGQAESLNTFHSK